MTEFPPLCISRVDVAHLSLYNLSVIHKKKYFDSELELMAFINENWDRLQLGEVRLCPSGLIPSVNVKSVQRRLLSSVSLSSSWTRPNRSDMNGFWKHLIATRLCKSTHRTDRLYTACVFKVCEIGVTRCRVSGSCPGKRSRRRNTCLGYGSASLRALRTLNRRRTGNRKKPRMRLRLKAGNP